MAWAKPALAVSNTFGSTTHTPTNVWFRPTRTEVKDCCWKPLKDNYRSRAERSICAKILQDVRFEILDNQYPDPPQIAVPYGYVLCSKSEAPDVPSPARHPDICLWRRRGWRRWHSTTNNRDHEKSGGERRCAERNCGTAACRAHSRARYPGWPTPRRRHGDLVHDCRGGDPGPRDYRNRQLGCCDQHLAARAGASKGVRSVRQRGSWRPGVLVCERRSRVSGIRGHRCGGYFGG